MVSANPPQPAGGPAELTTTDVRRIWPELLGVVKKHKRTTEALLKNAQVQELASSHLLYQTSPPDRLDMSPTFKCGIGYEAALGLARDVGINLHDLLWDPV